MASTSTLPLLPGLCKLLTSPANIQCRLLGLPQEILAHICHYAVQNDSPSYPQSIIPLGSNPNLPKLFQPIRACRQLYYTSKQQYLEANVLSIPEGSWGRIESCMAYSWPDPALHLSLELRITACPSRRHQFPDRTDARPNYAHYLRSGISLGFPHLKSFHLGLQFTEFSFFSLVEVPEPDFWRGAGHTITEENVFVTVARWIQLARNLPTKYKTVAWGGWRGDTEVRDMRGSDSRAIAEATMAARREEMYNGPIIRI